MPFPPVLACSVRPPFFLHPPQINTRMVRIASAIALSCLASSAMGFMTPAAPKASTTALAAKSKAVPFLDAPKSLDGTLSGDVGFDPLGLSDIDFDFSYLIVPTKWAEDRPGLPTVKWMAESEIKHGRFAMLAVVGTTTSTSTTTTTMPSHAPAHRIHI